VEIETTVKESQTSSEELREKYDVVIYKVKDCCSQAKAGYERNEHKADLAEKVECCFYLEICFVGSLYFGLLTVLLGGQPVC
jgi:hypothetical protein